MSYVLGIDTSSYTTSVALMDREGRLLSDQRRMLEVPLGERGIRQSKALFLHLKNLPRLLEALPSLKRDDLEAICVSTKPRPVSDSYLPVFLAGEELAHCLSSLFPIHLYRSSHQEGHVMAILWALNLSCQEFLSCQLSGGTTEIHRMKRRGPSLEIDLLGESLDLYAGQFIDRIGVAMGFPFPAGPSLEDLARESKGVAYPLPVSTFGLSMSFSGPASAAERALKEGVPFPSLARGVEMAIQKSVTEVLWKAYQETGIRHLLLLGGVFSNQFISCSLKKELESGGMKVYFGPPEYSRDNAVGLAYQALQFLFA